LAMRWRLEGRAPTFRVGSRTGRKHWPARLGWSGAVNERDEAGQSASRKSFESRGPAGHSNGRPFM
jgi:hypothetical protein